MSSSTVSDIKPGIALGSWAAFKRDGGVMVMGYLVLTEDEVEPVMMKLQEGGIHESAVHNHVPAAYVASRISSNLKGRTKQFGWLQASATRFSLLSATSA